MQQVIRFSLTERCVMEIIDITDEMLTEQELEVLLDEARRERHREAWSEYVGADDDN
jgi:hypothetical protein